MNSINENGISVCQAGKENYTTFVAGAFRGKEYIQYDYRTPAGELFYEKLNIMESQIK